MKKFAVYTASIGGYDEIHQPLAVDDRFDYIFFSDEVVADKVGVWQIRKIEYKNADKTRIARYVKTHPEELLPKYKATLWIDASIFITSKFIYDKVIELFDEDVLFASVRHPYRDCIYDEAYMVYGLDSEDIIFNWCHFLRSINYPRHNGLYESSIVYRLNCSNVKIVDDEWWNCIQSYSRRDQLSLNYVLWKNQIRQSYLLPVGEHMANSPNIKVQKHTRVSLDKGRRNLNQSFFEHTRCRCRVGVIEKQSQFMDFHYWLYGLNIFIAKFFLFIWGWCATIVYGPIIKLRANEKRKRK